MGSEYLLSKTTDRCNSSKVTILFLYHHSPTDANEFGDEAVARLAGLNGSIPNTFHDNSLSMFLSFSIIR